MQEQEPAQEQEPVNKIYLLPIEEDRNLFSKLLVKAFNLQDSLNSIIHPEWYKQKFNWNTAIRAEVGEILERYQGWKWWKKSKQFSEWTPEEKFQLALELIDILHFQLSFVLESFHNFEIMDGPADCAEYLTEELSTSFYKNIPGEQDEALKIFCGLDSLNPAMLECLFTFTAITFHYTPIQTLQLYFAKNALNEFRQDMQARPQGYNKIWASGYEDNHYLMEVFNELEEVATVRQDINNADSWYYDPATYCIIFKDELQQKFKAVERDCLPNTFN